MPTAETPRHERQSRRAIKPGELLALHPDSIHADDRGAFFWLFAPPSPYNERIGAVSVVRVNGPLEYHDDGWGDSYEAIVERVKDAMSGQDCVKRHEREHRWDEDYEPMEATKPKCVVLRIDSPGGVVAGLEQTVNELRRLSKESAIDLYAYVDETAYSAAQALCCACTRVTLPRSGFCGSIGVISTMVEQTAKDAKDGYRFVILTSGDRKADGHPHAPITDEAIDAERPRVNTLAQQFFGMVKRARGIPKAQAASWQARRFLGKEAVAAKLADDVMEWSAYIDSLNQVTQNGTDGSRPLASTGKSVQPQRMNKAEKDKALASVTALIEDAEKALASTTDAKVLASVAASLESYKKTKHMIEKHETEEGADEDEEDDEEDGAADEEDAKGDETDRKGGDDEDDSDDDGDDDDDSDEDDSKAAVAEIVRASGIDEKSKRVAFRKAVTETVRNLRAGSGAAKVLAAAQKMTGKKSASAIIDALQGQKAGIAGLKERLAKLETDGAARAVEDRKTKRDNLVNAAFNARRISPSEQKTLLKKSLAFCEQFLEMRPKAIVNVDGSEMPIPTQPGAALPEGVKKLLAAAGAMGVKPEDIQADMAKQNGAAGRV